MIGEVSPCSAVTLSRNRWPARETYSFYISKPMGTEIVAFMPVLNGRPPAAAAHEAFVNSAMDAVRQWQYDAPANGPIAFDVTFGFAPSSEARLLSEGVTIAGARQGTTPTKVKDVAPVYPPIAQSARVQGAVIIEARVEPDGHVSNARVLRSIPLLDKAARDAVMQWEFTPTFVNGKPAPVLVTTTVQFTLN